MFQASPPDWAFSFSTSYSPLATGTNCQSWLVAPVQASCSTAVPLAVLPPAALAHRPEFSLTTSYQAEVLMPEEPLAKVMECMFQPALSWSTTRVWVPAGRVTLAVTVVQ